MKRNLFFLLSIIVFLLGGCTLAPEYTRPEAPVPVHWPTGMAYIYTENAADESTPLASTLSWREFITDERLQKIIETALNNNLDLRLAVLNVERARALYGISRAGLLPSVNAAGIWDKEHIPADLSTTGNAVTS
jgi:multidrug efflux system outer membrane protein